MNNVYENLYRLIIEKKNKQMLEPHINTSYPNADIMLFLLIATTVNRQFDKANTVAAASTTTGGTLEEVLGLAVVAEDPELFDDGIAKHLHLDGMSFLNQMYNK